MEPERKATSSRDYPSSRFTPDVMAGDWRWPCQKKVLALVDLWCTQPDRPRAIPKSGGGAFRNLVCIHTAIVPASTVSG